MSGVGPLSLTCKRSRFIQERIAVRPAARAIAAGGLVKLLRRGVGQPLGYL